MNIKNIEINKVTKPKKERTNYFKRWWFGMRKELKRISYYKKKKILYDFITVLIICLILGGIVLCLDLMIIKKV